VELSENKWKYLEADLNCGLNGIREGTVYRRQRREQRRRGDILLERV